jgi:hypothetical protein
MHGYTVERMIMKEERSKQQETGGPAPTPVGVLGWILMLLLSLFLIYMALKFLVPKVAYS